MMDIRVGGPRHVVVHKGRQVEKVQHRNQNSEFGVLTLFVHPAEPKTLWSTKKRTPTLLVPKFVSCSNFFVEPSLLAFLYEQQHCSVHRDRHVYPTLRAMKPCEAAVAHQNVCLVIPNNFTKRKRSTFFCKFAPLLRP